MRNLDFAAAGHHYGSDLNIFQSVRAGGDIYILVHTMLAIQDYYLGFFVI
jgi:hypothetical protein